MEVDVVHGFHFVRQARRVVVVDRRIAPVGEVEAFQFDGWMLVSIISDATRRIKCDIIGAEDC